MPKDLYSKRLESLFSEAAPVKPDPAPAPPAPAPSEPAPRSVEVAAANGAAPAAVNGSAREAGAGQPPLARKVTGLLGGGPSEVDRFFELSQDLLGIVSAPGLFARVNPAFERVLGWSVKELLRTPFLDLVHAGDRPTTTAELDKLRQGATAVRIANRFRCQNGSDRWISWIVQAAADGSLYISGHDITDRRQAEEALRDSEARYRSLVESSHDAVISVGADGRFLFYNTVWLETLGYTAEAMARKTMFEVMHPDSVTHCQALFARLLAGEALSGVEVVFITAAGQPVIMEGNSTPRWQSGQVIATQSIFRNITARKQVENDLLKFRYALEHSTDAAFMTDVQGVIQYVNPAFEKVYGYRRDEAVGQTPRLLKSGVIPPEQYVHFWHALLNKQVVAGEIINKAKDGRLVPIEGSNTPIIDGDGRIVGFMAIHRDITARKAAEAALHASQARLAEALRIAQLANWEYDVPQDQFTFNDQFYALLRTTAEREGGYTMSSAQYVERFVHPDDAPLVGREIEKALTTTDPNFRSQVEHRIRRADDTPGYIAVRFRIEKDAQGRTVRTIGANQDITERQEVQERLKLQTVALEAAPDGIVITDNTGFIQWVNPAFTAMTGYTLAEAVNQHTSLLKSGRHDAAFYKTMWETVLAGEVWRGEVVNRRKDGSLFVEAQTITPLRNERGEIAWFVATKQDITARKEAEQHAAEHTAELELLNDLGRLLASQADLQTVLTQVGHRVCEVFEVDTGFITLYDPQTNILQFPFSLERGQPQPVPAMTLAGGLTERILRSRQPLLLADFDAAQAQALGAKLVGDGDLAKSWLGVPINVGADVIGVINVQSQQAGRFTPEDVRLLTTIAANIGTEIENARLLEQSRRRAAELATVAQVGVAVATLREQAVMLQTVVDLAKERFGLYHAHLYLFNAEGDTLVLQAGAGEIGRQMVAEGRRLPLSRQQSLVAQAARERRVVVVNDVSQDPHFLPHPLLPLTRSELAAPLLVADQVLGVLDVQSDAIGRFSGEDANIQMTLAVQIAVALQNARSFERSEQALTELNALTRRLTQDGWRDYLLARPSQDYAYQFDLAEVVPLQPVAAPATVAEAGLAERLLVQGEPVGQLSVAEPALAEAEAQAIVAAVAERLSAHLENLRLNEQTLQSLSKQEHLAAQLETVVQVTTVASTLLEGRQLLQEVADLTRQRFGLYHAQIFLYDDISETLQLAAGSGDVGRQLVAEERLLPVLLEQSVVARAARTRQPMLVADLAALERWQSHPLLPQARSEMALPMLVGERLLGVFDVQSDQPGRFSEEDARIQGTLAAQVAIALQNANLYAEQAATVARLQELDQLKSSFLANMSHELRTPLNSILGFTDVILEGLDGPLTDRMDNDLKVVQKNGQHLLNLINDILDMAKIEAGRMSISPERLDLADVVAEVIDITGSLAREKRLALRTQLPPDEALYLEADHIRLRQVLINLVGNAVKFTETGGVTIAAERHQDRLLITVSDTGMGIPAEKLETIFEAFSQVDTSTTRKVGGTGLGLPISRRLIELHGGRLWAESRGLPGEGARLCVELPVEFKHSSLEVEAY